MADFIITGPDGKRYKVTGETPEGAVGALKKMLGQGVSGDQSFPPDNPKAERERIAAGVARNAQLDTGRAERQAGIDYEAEQRLRDPGAAQAFAIGAGQGITLGFGDEITGGMAAVGGAVKDAVTGNFDGMGDRMSGRYARARDDMRAAKENANFARPKTTFAGELAGGLAIPVGGASTSLLKTTGKAALVGAGYGAGTAEGGIESRIAGAVSGGMMGGALGAASVPLGKVLGWATSKGGSALRGVFANRKFFNGGQLTDEGAETLRALGYNLDDLGAAFQSHFQAGIKKGIAPQEAASAASLSEFGIPALRANVTGSADDFATLYRGRSGALGPSVEAQVKSAMNAQDEAMRSAGTGISTRLAGGASVDAGQAAETAMTAARSARDAAKSTASAAYDELAAAGGGVGGKQATKLGTRIARNIAMSDQPVRIDPTSTPNAANAAAYLDDVFAKAGKRSVPFMQLERARQQLVRYNSAAYRGSNGADNFAMSRMVESFDDEVDAMMTRALTAGNKDVLEKASNARALWSQYAKKFTGKDASAKFIQKMTDEDASPDQVVNWLFGAGKLGTGGFTATVARGVKDVVGDDAWNAIRSAAFQKLTTKPEGMAQPGPQAISERIGDFFTNPATRDLSRTMFAKEEISNIMRYQAALRKMIPPPGAVNTSGTAYENARMVRQAFSAVAGMLGASTGGVPGMLAAQGASAAAGRGKNWLTARAIMNPGSPTAFSGSPRASGFVAGKAAEPIGRLITNQQFLNQPE